MSDEQNTERGETEEEYYERVKNVPGFFNDRHQTAREVVEGPDQLVKDAEVRAELSPLAPATELGEDQQPVEETEPSEEDLLHLKRADLNEQAENKGVEDPIKLPNKEAVVEAIGEHEGEGEKGASDEDAKAASQSEQTKSAKPKNKKEADQKLEDDSTGPAGEYAQQLPAEEEAGQPPRPTRGPTKAQVVNEKKEDDSKK